MKGMLCLAALAFYCLGLSACLSVGPDYQRPELPTPARFGEQESTETSVLVAPADEERLASWWQLFDDPVLNRLIERTVADNFDVREAVERIVEARARIGQITGRLYPQLDATAAYNRAGRIDGEDGGVLTASGFGTSDDFFSAGIDASWEVDLFGKIRRSEEAALRDAERLREAMRDTLVTLISDIASTYVQLRTLQRRMVIVEGNIKIQRESLELAQARSSSGLVSRLDVTQARTNLLTTQAAIPPLRAEIEGAVQRLGILIGGYPDAARELISDGEVKVPSVPSRLRLGAPAELLRRRADIRAAEREMAAQTARIGMAEADFYPQLSLFGSIGIQATDAGDLLESDTGIYSFGPSFRWNFFNAEQVKQGVAIEKSRLRQVTLRYEASLRRAVQEVETSVARLVEEQRRRLELEGALAFARESVELANAQYTEGIVSFQSVLDTERTLLDLEGQLAVSRGSVTSYAIALFKALGGGWQTLQLKEK